MNVRWTKCFVTAALALGCSGTTSDSSSGDSDASGDAEMGGCSGVECAGGDGGGATDAEWPDYSDCLLHKANDCDGLDCATNAQEERWVQLILDVLDEKGLSDRLTLADADFLEDSDQVLVSFFLKIDWFEAWHPFSGLKTSMSEEEFKQELSDWLDSFAPYPEEIRPYREALEAMDACHPDVAAAYSHCDHNFFYYYDGSEPPIVRVSVPGTLPVQCPSELHLFSFNIVTGEVACATDREPDTVCED